MSRLNAEEQREVLARLDRAHASILIDSPSATPLEQHWVDMLLDGHSGEDVIKAMVGKFKEDNYAGRL